MILICFGETQDKKNYGLAALISNFGARSLKVSRSQGFDSIAFMLDTLLDVYKKTFRSSLDPKAIKNLLVGASLADYTYEKKSQKNTLPNPAKVSLVSKKKISKPIFQEASILEKAVTFTRNLGNDPANFMTPRALAHSAEKLFKSTRARVKILEPDAIKKLGMTLFLSVNKGSHEPARLIEINYTGPSRKKKLPKIALVGKGITFDSGGYCLKSFPGMLDMKFDMCGGATMLGVTYAVAQLGLPISLKTIVPATENLVNGKANKPGDVIQAMNQSTVEIDNTDAEGRLILADALTYASHWKPDYLIDAATLTGAVVMALGSPATGVMGNNSKFFNKISESAECVGERVWELPLFPEYDAWFDSPVADFKNISVKREAGSSCAGTFLKKFVPNDIPWLHLDIAGTAWNNSTRAFYPEKGASGAMVMTLAQLLEQLSK